MFLMGHSSSAYSDENDHYVALLALVDVTAVLLATGFLLFPVRLGPQGCAWGFVEELSAGLL